MSTSSGGIGGLISSRDYQVAIPRPVEKQLDKLPGNANSRVLERSAALKSDPRPRGCVKPKGKVNEYRIRIGDYRVRYEVRDQDRLVLLLY